MQARRRGAYQPRAHLPTCMGGQKARGRPAHPPAPQRQAVPEARRSQRQPGFHQGQDRHREASRNSGAKEPFRRLGTRYCDREKPQGSPAHGERQGDRDMLVLLDGKESGPLSPTTGKSSPSTRRLLAYSPDLNPVERVWWHMRKSFTHNRYPASLKERIAMFRRLMSGCLAPNDLLKNICVINY